MSEIIENMAIQGEESVEESPLGPGSKLDYVVGLSPQYWAHIPMFVTDVLSLKLKDGINWMASPPAEFDCVSPVSKCLLVGWIVYVSERRDGSMAYVLDDGTGLIDCVYWSSGNGNIEDIYYLPSLSNNTDGGIDGPFAVGSPVRVFGKIDCVASTLKTQYRKDEEAFVVREVQASIIERIDNYLIAEAQHWARSRDHVYDNIHSSLEALGPEIRSQIEERLNLPAVDDTVSAWRVFGVSCNCNLNYMDELLYCHCQCKSEPLDPSYRFRDALLHILLAMQSQAKEKFLFKYKDVRNNEEIQNVALREVVAEKKMSKNALLNDLFVKTFRALRHDGILSLINDYTDEYLLITKSKVLEPFVKEQMSNGESSSKAVYINYENAPAFISRVVHGERLLYIKRLLVREEEISSTIPTH